MTHRGKLLATFAAGLLGTSTSLAQQPPPYPPGARAAPGVGYGSPPPPIYQAASPYPPPPPGYPQAPSPAPIARSYASEEEPSHFGGTLDFAFSYLAHPPALQLLTPGGVQMHQFGDNPITPFGATYMFSMGLSAMYRTGAFVLPLVGVEFGFPVATGYPGSVDVGTQSNPLSWVKTGGSTYYDGLDLFGLGLQLNSGGFRFGINVKPGFRYLRMSGTLTQVLLTVDADAHQYTFSLRGDVEVCYAAASVTSGCLFAAPHLYEFSEWLNGGVLGLRFETN